MDCSSESSSSLRNETSKYAPYKQYNSAHTPYCSDGDNRQSDKNDNCNGNDAKILSIQLPMNKNYKRDLFFIGQDNHFCSYGNDNESLEGESVENISNFNCDPNTSDIKRSHGSIPHIVRNNYYPSTTPRTSSSLYSLYPDGTNLYSLADHTYEDSRKRLEDDAKNESPKVVESISRMKKNGKLSVQHDNSRLVDSDDDTVGSHSQSVASPSTGKIFRIKSDYSNDIESHQNEFHVLNKSSLCNGKKQQHTKVDVREFDIRVEATDSISSSNEFIVHNKIPNRKNCFYEKKKSKKVETNQDKKVSNNDMNIIKKGIFSLSSSTEEKVLSNRFKVTPENKVPLRYTRISKQAPVMSEISSVKERNIAEAIVVEEGEYNNSDLDDSAVDPVEITEVIPQKLRKKPGPKPGSKRKRNSLFFDRGKSYSHLTRKKPGPKPGSKNKRVRRALAFEDESIGEGISSTSVISHEKLQAAEQARDILIRSIQNIPVKISENQRVRNFGRIKIEEGIDTREALYSSPNALLPVGFSCDRYEFSPTHGRVIKMRCDILDGSKVIQEEEIEMRGENENDFSSDILNSHIKDDKHYNGPIFRIMWGRGIDRCTDNRSFPFDLYSSSAPINGDIDITTTPLGYDTSSVVPESGMRVKVRFENSIWYGGYIHKVQAEENHEHSGFELKSPSGPKNKTKFNIMIIYDDGAEEYASYPDPDILLLPPGSEETNEGCIVVLNNLKISPVTTVIGKNVLEVWGKTLIKLGLIDEIMFENSLKAVSAARLKGLAEVKGKMEATRTQRQEARGRLTQRSKERDYEEDNIKRQNSIIVRVKGGQIIKHDGIDDDVEEFSNDENKESCLVPKFVKDDPTVKEQNLREKVNALLKTYRKRFNESRIHATTLADARISLISPFLVNPFHDVDSSIVQQKNWLATVIRKEKAKMGSTGNRRKIITATDLLERNATFFNSDVERLIEGLPGSEFCSSYVFHDLRGTGIAAVNQSWVHETHLRQEREELKRRKRADEYEAKASSQREKERKRKAREDERETRKKQKMEELEEKKKAREEERLSRLSTQIDERLFKESFFQRERVIMYATKLISKEMSRRRRAGEVLAAHAIEQSVDITKILNTCYLNETFRKELPPLHRRYDGDVLRIWNFMLTYQVAFVENGDFSILPNLNDLQNAIECIRYKTSKPSSREKAVNFLTKLCITICKPISVGLVKTMSTVLNTSLQEKDCYATSESKSANSIESNHSDPDYYPVNIFTWKEVARLALLSDALNDLGYSKQEQAHLLRGFRSGGHPNSKEAKRLRRGEDYALVLRQQALTEVSSKASFTENERTDIESLKVKVCVPCQPRSYPAKWFFFLHSLRSLPGNAYMTMKSNLRKAIFSLKAAPRANFSNTINETITSELQYSLSILEQIDSTRMTACQVVNECNRVKQIVLRILDQMTAEKVSTDVMLKSFYGPISLKSCKAKEKPKLGKPKVSKNLRERMGLLNSLVVTEDHYKKLILKKEEYMLAAIKLKEERDREKKRQERKSKREATDPTVENDEEDEDDNEDEDDEEEEEENDKQRGLEDENKHQNTETVVETEVTDSKIGKKTIYDHFCGDDPEAPELIRRCLAVLRTLCCTSPAEPFIFPVDPTSNPKYYEAILRPISLYDIGKFLLTAGKLLTKGGKMQKDEADIENVVMQFGRNVRLIKENCMCISNVAGAIISSAEEMIRVFERLFFDWVLVPSEMQAPLEYLDDDRCVEYHHTDEESMVLLCDGCEGKFNMSRLDPPLLSVPQDDWYCPRCLCGRRWVSVDPRIGRKVRKRFTVDQVSSTKLNVYGVVKKCLPSCREGNGTEPILVYIIQYDDGDQETWSIDMVDEALKEYGEPVAPIRCLKAVAESPGYGSPSDNGFVEMVPVPLNPVISDSAAQKAVSSTVFQDTILVTASLVLNDTSGMTASDWLKLLILLTMKCATTEHLQNIMTKMENDAYLKVSASSSLTSRIKSIHDVITRVSFEDDDQIKDVKPGNYLAVGNSKIVENEGSDDEKVRSDVKNSPVSVLVSKDSVQAHSFVDEVEKKKNALKAHRDIQKAREDRFFAHCMKSQMKAVIASFDGDQVSEVIEATLCPQGEGGDLSSYRCHDIICDFCGLSDVALGTPLIRAPSNEEWVEIMQYAARNVYLIAMISKENIYILHEGKGFQWESRGLTMMKEDSLITVTNEELHHTYYNEQKCKDDLNKNPVKEEVEGRTTDIAKTKRVSSKHIRHVNKTKYTSKGCKKLLLVKIRLSGELLTITNDDNDEISNIFSCGMEEFMLRNSEGFQHDLQSRLKDSVPSVTGSLSAHDCCAVAAHNARIGKMVQEKKDVIAENSERHYGNSCGRTTSLGSDSWGRSYWKFDADPLSLFVHCQSNDKNNKGKEFHRFSEPETIASVINCLRKEKLYDELKILFPESTMMLDNGKWIELLHQRQSSNSLFDEQSQGNIHMEQMSSVVKEHNYEIDKKSEPYEEGECVLVKSLSGKLLWDARIVAVGRKCSDEITGYRVHYKEWNKRFDEWVNPTRVQKLNEKNFKYQVDLFAKMVEEKDSISSILNVLVAKTFVNAPDRAKINQSSPKYSLVSAVGPGGTAEDKMMGILKASMLLVETALPLGSVNTSYEGSWNPHIASFWRSMVTKADDPGALIGCLILLENVISIDWLRPNAEHLLSFLPRPWKAVNEVSLSSIALRLWILDRGIKYGLVYEGPEWHTLKKAVRRLK